MRPLNWLLIIVLFGSEAAYAQGPTMGTAGQHSGPGSLPGIPRTHQESGLQVDMQGRQKPGSCEYCLPPQEVPLQMDPRKVGSTLKANREVIRLQSESIFDLRARIDSLEARIIKLEEKKGN